MQYLCYIYRHEDDFQRYVLSEENEDLEHFRKRMLATYSRKCLCHHLFFKIELVV